MQLKEGKILRGNCVYIHSSSKQLLGILIRVVGSLDRGYLGDKLLNRRYVKSSSGFTRPGGK